MPNSNNKKQIAFTVRKTFPITGKLLKEKLINAFNLMWDEHDRETQLKLQNLLKEDLDVLMEVLS